jgi:hypothetical protein
VARSSSMWKIDQRERPSRPPPVDETRYYDLKREANRFYLVDSFVQTDAKKTSPGGIWGLRYLDLSKILTAYNPRKDYTSEELATALKDATWE